MSVDNNSKSKLRNRRLIRREDDIVSTKPNQRSTKYVQKFVPQAAKFEKPDSSKTKISKLQHQAETVAEKIEKARDKAKGIKRATPADKIGNNIPQVCTNVIHNKINESEHENVAAQAVNRTVQAAECVHNKMRSAYRFVRDSPVRQAVKLENKSARINTKLTYHKTVRDNPKLQSNLISRQMQKHRIKKQYAKAARDVKRGIRSGSKSGVVAAKSAKKLVAVIAKNPKVWLVIAVLFMLFFLVSSCMSSLVFLIGGINNEFSGTYLADENNITAASVLYTEWETDLNLRIENAETEHAEYHEYRYNIGYIGHDPFVLMAYLTAVYGDFNADDITTNMQELFNEQYQLQFVEQNGRLNINLFSHSLEEIVSSKMNREQIMIYESCMESRGNRQFVGSPISGDWLPRITSYYGYRIHPIRGGKGFHTGLDIPMPTGTDLLAVHDGRVVRTSNDPGGYGLFVVIENSAGTRSLYAHCDSFSVSEGQTINQGDIIAKSGNTGGSTGPHLHIELRQNGVLLNPIYFMDFGGLV